MSYQPIPVLGQATMANSLPVVIASDQSTLPISIAAATASIAKAEDSAAVTGDTGSFSLSVANVAQTALAADGDYIARAADLAGNSMVVGNVASATTDAGNPVKVGAICKTTLPTVTDGQRVDLQSDTRGVLRVVLFGNNTGAQLAVSTDNADGVAASATSNKLGVLSRNTLANGSNWDRQSVVVNATNSVGTGIAAAGLVAQVDDTSPTAITENSFGNVRMSQDHSLLTTIQNSYSHISTATTTTVKSGAGTLHAVIVNTLGTVASTTTIYDNTAGSGTVIGIINTLALGGTFTFDIQFATGLTLVTTGTVAPDITVSYK